MTEAEKEIYEDTKKRLRRLGIENPAEVIVQLAGEIAYYRKKIQQMEECYANKITVVKCKDCIYRKTPHHCALWYGHLNGSEYFIERGDDFYCPYGVNKEGGEEE